MRFKLLILILFLLGITLWLAVLTYPKSNLKIIACDVSQGDAILITHRDRQILIDGGKPHTGVIDCLSKYVPFWDRAIEIVMITHPQLDHYGGLIEVFERYEVNTLLANSLDSDSQEYQVLKSLVGGSSTKVVSPVQGQVVRLGLISLDMVNPTQEFLVENSHRQEKAELSKDSNRVLGTTVSKIDPNDFSLVAILHYGNFDALFTGDIGPKISDKVAAYIKQKEKDPIEYLKVPHHGSKNGLSQSLLDATSFKIAVISDGKNNSYGHPHKEILDLLHDHKIRILRTDEIGDIVMETDGTEIKF